MSLTTQLAGGELGRWCAATLTGTGRLAAEVAAATTGARPVRPSRVDHTEHWATIGGAFGQRLAFATQPDLTVPDLLAAVPDHQVAELVELAARAHGSATLAQLAPGGISGPVFVEHWADGDLLIPTPHTNTAPAAAAGAAAGAGMTLLDIKTVISMRDPDRVARWMWQLLGYAWLDQADRYRIRAVGLYLARHGALITWPLDRFAAALLDGRDVDAAAMNFRRLAARVITTEPANRPGQGTIRPDGDAVVTAAARTSSGPPGASWRPGAPSVVSLRRWRG